MKTSQLTIAKVGLKSLEGLLKEDYKVMVSAMHGKYLIYDHAFPNAGRLVNLNEESRGEIISVQPEEKYSIIEGRYEHKGITIEWLENPQSYKTEINHHNDWDLGQIIIAGVIPPGASCLEPIELYLTPDRKEVMRSRAADRNPEQRKFPFYEEYLQKIS